MRLIPIGVGLIDPAVVLEMDAANFSFVDITERDMDFLFAEELECDPAFRAWLLERTGGSEGVQGLLRVGRSVSTRHGETDLLLVHWTEDGSRRAVMIENKVGAAFMPLQAERYRVRGKEGVQTGEWDAFTTVLIAPKKRLEGVSVHLFDHHISYEECEQALSGSDARALFKRRILQAACGKAKVPWVASIDPATTKWFADAHQFGISEFPDLPLPAEGRGRAPGNTWITFYLKEFPLSRVGIEIKPLNGVVDLRMAGVPLGDLRRAIGNVIPDGAKIEMATSGKSVAVRFKHAPADLASPFTGQEACFRSMFSSAETLIRFALERKANIIRLLGYEPQQLHT